MCEVVLLFAGERCVVKAMKLTKQGNFQAEAIDKHFEGWGGKIALRAARNDRIMYFASRLRGGGGLADGGSS